MARAQALRGAPTAVKLVAADVMCSSVTACWRSGSCWSAGELAGLSLAASLVVAVALASITGGRMVVGEILSKTALPRILDDEVLARAYCLTLTLLGAMSPARCSPPHSQSVQVFARDCRFQGVRHPTTSPAPERPQIRVETYACAAN